LGKVQIADGWEVHATPLDALGWHGTLGAHPRGRHKLVGCLCPRFQSHVDYGPLKK